MYQHPSSHFASAFSKLAGTLRQRGRRRGRSRSTPGGVGAHTFESLESRTLLTTTVSLVFDMEGAPVENATSSLTRSADDISLTVDTVGLSAGVYMLSVIAFNNPENCMGDCGTDDYEREEVNTSKIFGIGEVVEQSGAATLTAQFVEGDASRVLFGPGLLDTFEAEVQFVLRSKGPVIPGQLEEQLTTVDGGCPPSGCEDLQTGHHMSPLTQVTVNPVDLVRHVPFPNPGAVSRLTRYEDGIAMRIDTLELDPGAYTVWMVAFNNPDQCVDSCGGDDLDREEVNASVMWGAGEVVDESGEATFFIRRDVGDTTRVLRGPGLLSPFDAEIHSPVRTHGPVIPDSLEEQLTTLNGGCPPNTCSNVQATAHFPDPDSLPNLLITSLDATDTGFTAEFSALFAANSLNLYDSETGLADAVLQGEISGSVPGSLVVDPSLRKVTFVKSGGPLEPDIYTVTLRGGTDGFKSRAGNPIEGNGSGDSADDFVSSFTVVAAGDAITVGMPDFVRGPGQEVNLPADGTTGIPMSLSNGVNVRTVDLQISYDSALLEITGATVGNGMPVDATIEFDNSTAGLVTLQLASPASLPAGGNTFVTLHATVPTTNPNRIYLTQQVLDIHSVTVTDGNDNEFPVIADDALHLASYFADVSGNGRINASDAAQVARVAALLDNGFGATLLTDPGIVGDISGNGRINAADASLVARSAALIDVPQIPPIPGGVVIAGLGPGLASLPPRLADHSSSPRVDDSFDSSMGSTDLAATGNTHYPAVDRVLSEMSNSEGLGNEEKLAMTLEAAIEELLESALLAD